MTHSANETDLVLTRMIHLIYETDLPSEFLLKSDEGFSPTHVETMVHRPE